MRIELETSIDEAGLVHVRLTEYGEHKKEAAFQIAFTAIVEVIRERDGKVDENAVYVDTLWREPTDAMTVSEYIEAPEDQD